MAGNTGSSGNSSLAPTDFKFSGSLDESHGTVISVAVEHCQLCGGTRRLFYCKDCVSNGEFTHSLKTHDERYASKLKRWQSLKKERLKLLERFEKAMTKSREAETKKCDIQFRQERINLLKKAIKSAQDNLTKEEISYQTTVESLKKSNESRRTQTWRRSEKLLRIKRYLKQGGEQTARSQVALKETEAVLYTVRRQHVADLLHFIFPISEIQPKSDTDSMVLSTVSALAEARRTAYIRGRWVYTDNGGEHQYCIVEPTLPGNGDYTAYSIWLSENKYGVPSNETEHGQRNPAYTLSAALTYTSQLVKLLAHFLDVNLPKKMCYSEFCGQEKTEVQFDRAVSRLNHNVLHLCFTQSVSPELLHPRHTIHNLLVLLEAQSLGRVGPFEVTPELMLSLDESHQSEGSELEMTSSEDEVDQNDQDWERVAISPLDFELAPRSADSYLTSQLDTHAAGQDGMTAAGGFMSSVASFWRAATSRMDHK